MDYFAYKDGMLYVEDVKVSDIIAAHPTPFYLYSANTLRHHGRVYQEALSCVDGLVAYAVKANVNKSVMSTLFKEGLGADVVSYGELYRAMAAGVDPRKVVFSGVGKTRKEIAYGLHCGIYQFNVESFNELKVIEEVAQSEHVQADVAFRINPGVDGHTHDKIATGLKKSKFGLDFDTAKEAYVYADASSSLRPVGLSVHIGSQIVTLEPFRQAMVAMADFVGRLRAMGLTVERLDVGGGVGITYDTEKVFSLASYGEMIRDVLGDLGCSIIAEPGRLIVGNAGVLVSSLIYKKHSYGRIFYILDSSMNDLMRPALYQARYHIAPIVQKDVPDEVVTLAGSVCESGDVFVEDYSIASMDEGDSLVFRTSGAYGSSMSSAYNSRPFIAEIMVDKTDIQVVRKCAEVSDLMLLEK